MVIARAFFVHTAGPDTALIKSGGRKKSHIVISGRMLSIPIMQRVDSLSLALRTITVYTKGGLTVNGVSVDMTATCQVKIVGWNTETDVHVPNERATKDGHDLAVDYAAIRLAAQHFLGKSDEQIEDAIQRTIAGHQRAIVGVLTVEELYRDRAAFCRRVLDLCSEDMRSMGLVVVSYVVAEISDENGYVEALGVAQTELVKREAAEGLAVHQAQARVRTAQEDAEAHLQVNKQNEVKIDSDKKRSLTEAKAQEEVLRRQAIKDRAHDISLAEQDAVLLVRRQEATAAETRAQLEVLKQQVELEKLQKMKAVNVEADALLYKAKIEAEAKEKAAEAEAKRERLVGEAQAATIRAKGMAEIELLRERNRIWKETENYGAIMERLVEALPQVAASIAAPLQQTEKMVFVAGGPSGRGGPSQFTAEVNQMVAQVPETVHALTGFDMTGALNKLIDGKNGEAIVQGTAEGVATALVSKN